MAVSEARKAFLAICQELASALADDGVTFARSGPYLRVGRGPWHCEMRCQTSHYNRADDVDLTMYYTIQGDRVAEYRATTIPIEPRGEGFVAGGMLNGGEFPHQLPFGYGRPSATGTPGPAVMVLADHIRRGPLFVLQAVQDPTTALDAVPETLIFGNPSNWIDYVGAHGQVQLISPLLNRLLAGGRITWSGPVFDRRDLLLDSQRQLLGLPACTNHSPYVVDGFVSALRRANATEALLGMSL